MEILVPGMDGENYGVAFEVDTDANNGILLNTSRE